MRSWPRNGISPRTGRGQGALSVALALALGIVVAAPAVAAEDGDVPEVDQILYFTNLGGTNDVQVWLDRWTEESEVGVPAVHEGVGNFEDLMITRAEGGDLPDLALFPQPGLMADIHDIAPLLSLEELGLLEETQANYDPALLELLEIDGAIRGVPGVGFINSTIWYHRGYFEENGLEPPGTWEELVQLTEQIAASGQTPWCVAMEAGSTSGWAGADWIMDQILAMHGADVFNGWSAGEIPSSDPRIKAAFEEVGRILLNEDFIFGGRDRVLATSIWEQMTPMLQDPPACVLSKLAAFGRNVLAEQTEEYDPVTLTNSDGPIGFFLHPRYDAEAGQQMVTNGSFIGVFNDSVQTRDLAGWLSSAEYQEAYAAEGLDKVPQMLNKSADPAAFGDDEMRTFLQQQLAEAPVTGFNAVDRMPSQVAFNVWNGIYDWAGGADLDQVLATIDASWEG